MLELWINQTPVIIPYWMKCSFLPALPPSLLPAPQLLLSRDFTLRREGMDAQWRSTSTLQAWVNWLNYWHCTSLLFCSLSRVTLHTSVRTHCHFLTRNGFYPLVICLKTLKSVVTVPVLDFWLGMEACGFCEGLIFHMVVNASRKQWNDLQSYWSETRTLLQVIGVVYNPKRAVINNAFFFSWVNF